MAEITAAMVKELRERTSAGMMECKKALVEANGDMTLAEEVIAKSGHKKAAKSAGRTAAEGRITIVSSPECAIIVEVNCETDFVGRDENFIKYCDTVANIALQNQITDVEKLLNLPFDGSMTIEDARKNLIVKIGENIQLRRVALIKAGQNQRFGTYIHHARIGVITLVEGGNNDVAKDMAMHIAAMKPQYLTIEEVPAATVEKQQEIFTEIAGQSGKPANIIEKIVAGQIQKHFAEVCLAGQPFFKDPDQTVAAFLKSNQANVVKMIRFEVGEGIEVIKKSFEEEVSLARGQS